MPTNTINGWNAASLSPSYSVVQSILGSVPSWSPGANLTGSGATSASLATAPWSSQSQNNSGWVTNPGLIPAAISGVGPGSQIYAPLPKTPALGGLSGVPLNLAEADPKTIFARLRAASIAKAAADRAAANGPPPLTPGTINWAGGALPPAPATGGFGDTEGLPAIAGLELMINHASSRTGDGGGSVRGAERQMAQDRLWASINGAPQNLLDSLTLVPIIEGRTPGRSNENPNKVRAAQQAAKDREILGEYLTGAPGWI